MRTLTPRYGAQPAVTSPVDEGEHEVLTTADGSRTLRSAGGESFKSEKGALSEARAVYLEGSGVGERLRSGLATRVLEVGFGAGLNFLASGSLALATGAPLDYHALELDLPPAGTMASLGYADLLAPSPLPAAVIAWRATLTARPALGPHHLRRGAVALTLHLGDARLCDWQPAASGTFDAVYHDAFSPHKTPELWEEGFLRLLAAQLTPTGRLVSFSVAGAVRRALAAAGLIAERVPGPPGGKREVLVARRAAAP